MRNEFSGKMLVEYHTRVFWLLNADLMKSGYDPELPHPSREKFWKVVPLGEYANAKARELLEQYLEVLERDVKDVVSEHSLAYWLHL